MLFKIDFSFNFILFIVDLFINKTSDFMIISNNISTNNSLFTKNNTNQSTAQKLHHFVPSGYGQTIGTAWQKFKDFFLRPTELYKSIRSLAGEKQIHLMVNKQLISRAMLGHEYSKVSSFLKDLFKRSTSKEVFQFISELYKEFLTSSIENKAQISIHTLNQRIIESVQLAKLEEAAKTQIPLFKNTLQSALNIAKVIKNQITTDLEEKNWKIKETLVMHLINTFEWVVDTTMTIFHLYDMFEDTPESSTEAHHRLQILLSLFTSIGVVAALISSYAGNTLLAAGFIGIAVITLGTLLHVYFTYYKPCPETLPGCINYTSEAIKGNIDPTLGRDQCINEIIELLSSNLNGTRVHPLLIGKSGVGKTEIFKGLAYKIAKGDVPKNLRNKKVFYINTTDLIAGGAIWGRMSTLTQILRKIRRNENKCIIIFDEIHNALKNRGGSILGEKLKTILDPGPGALPFCVSATTPEEYKLYIKKNIPFVRRFKKIKIEEIDRSSFLLILNKFMYKEAPDLEISEAAMNVLKEMPTLFKAKSILSKAISHLRTFHNQKLRDDLQKETEKRLTKELSFMRGNGLNLSLETEEGQKILNEIDTIDTKVQSIRRELEKQEEKFVSFQKIKDQLNAAKQEMLQTALKIKKSEQKNCQALIDQFHLLQMYINPVLESVITSYKNSEGRQTEINKALIDKLVEEDRVEALG